MNLAELARLLGATLDGDPEFVPARLASLGAARPSDLAFVMPKRAFTTAAGALIVATEHPSDPDRHLLRVGDVYAAYARVSAYFDSAPRRAPGVHPSAVVDPSATIGSGAYIGPGAVIEAGVTVGEGCVIESQCVVGADSSLGARSHLMARVTLYHGVRIGADCRVHSGAVIGADGFGFAPSADGWQKIHQIGGVVIGDDCEIGANSCIDRGALDDTRIGHGVKIDDQVMIAHNCVIGDRTAIAACVGMAGSTQLGADCTVGGGAGFTGHIAVCDKVHIGAMTLVAGDIDVPGAYAGGVQGARPMRAWKKNVARFNQLDALARRLIALEKRDNGTKE